MSEFCLDKSTKDQIHHIIITNRSKEIERYCLFLDFDGVINVFIDPDTENAEEILRKKASEFDFADRDCVHRLDQLLHDYPIDVVISSSWRRSGLDYCAQYLKKTGLKNLDTIVGTTETDYNTSRPEHIARYLLAHPQYSGFLIFDDDPMPDFEDVSVLTHPFRGYDEERDEKARSIIAHFEASSGSEYSMNPDFA
jgi:hypothetical protein